MSASTTALALAATFGHEPSEVHTASGPTGRMCCGQCFVVWPCAVVRKIERVMVPVVERLINQAVAAELRAQADGTAVANWPEWSRPVIDLRARADELDPS